MHMIFTIQQLRNRGEKRPLFSASSPQLVWYSTVILCLLAWQPLARTLLQQCNTHLNIINININNKHNNYNINSKSPNLSYFAF